MTRRKQTNDIEIIGLNSVGLSLAGIGQRLGVHHTTVTSRLKILGIAPADTRRAFMEDIYDKLTDAQRDWLIEQLSGGRPIKDFVKNLIINEYVRKK